MATMEPGRNPVGDLEVIEAELAKYGGLEDRPRLVALNKIDVPDGREMVDLVLEDIAAKGWDVVPVSAASHEGLRELSFAMAEVVAARRRAQPQKETQRIVIRPKATSGNGAEFTVRETGEGWRVRGEKPERWIRQTDFSNDEAVGFLADRLNRLGVEEKLLALGAVEGDPVLIGDPANAVVFDFKPGLDAGAGEMLGRRGEDHRFDDSRPAAHRRRSIDEQMDERAEGETRADVARRLDRPVAPSDDDRTDEDADRGVTTTWTSGWEEDDPDSRSGDDPA
jgi:GTP-binding protein